MLLIAPALEPPQSALAQGDEGHTIVALIAEHYFDPGVGTKVANLLTGGQVTRQQPLYDEDPLRDYVVLGPRLAAISSADRIGSSAIITTNAKAENNGIAFIG